MRDLFFTGSNSPSWNRSLKAAALPTHTSLGHFVEQSSASGAAQPDKRKDKWKSGDPKDAKISIMYTQSFICRAHTNANAQSISTKTFASLHLHLSHKVLMKHSKKHKVKLCSNYRSFNILTNFEIVFHCAVEDNLRRYFPLLYLYIYQKIRAEHRY